MYITKYYSKTFHNFKIHSIAKINFFWYAERTLLTSQRFMTERNSPETHIYLYLYTAIGDVETACAKEKFRGVH